jgi:hypothetical protein
LQRAEREGRNLVHEGAPGLQFLQDAGAIPAQRTLPLLEHQHARAPCAKEQPTLLNYSDERTSGSMNISRRGDARMCDVPVTMSARQTSIYAEACRYRKP